MNGKRLRKGLLLLAGVVLGLVAMGCASSSDNVLEVPQEGFVYFADSNSGNIEGYEIDPSTGNMNSFTTRFILALEPSFSDIEASERNCLLLSDRGLGNLVSIPLDPQTGVMGSETILPIMQWTADAPQDLLVDGGLAAVVGFNGLLSTFPFVANPASAVEFVTVADGGAIGTSEAGRIELLGVNLEGKSARLEGGFFVAGLGIGDQGTLPGGGLFHASVSAAGAVTTTGLVPIVEGSSPDAVWVHDVGLGSSHVFAVYRTVTGFGVAVFDRNGDAPTLAAALPLTGSLSGGNRPEILVSGTRGWVATDDGAGTTTIHVVDAAAPGGATTATAIVLPSSQLVRPSFVTSSFMVMTGQEPNAFGPGFPWVKSFEVDEASGTLSAVDTVMIATGISLGSTADEGKLQIVCDGNGASFQVVVVDPQTGLLDDRDVFTLTTPPQGTMVSTIYLKP